MAFAVAAIPLALRNRAVEHWIAVDVATVEITLVAYEQHILVIPTATHITDEVVLLFEYHLLWLHFHNLRLLVLVDFGQIIEFCPTARAGCRRFSPYIYTFKAEFMLAIQNSIRGLVLGQTNWTDVVVKLPFFSFDCHSFGKVNCHPFRFLRGWRLWVLLGFD